MRKSLTHDGRTGVSGSGTVVVEVGVFGGGAAGDAVLFCSSCFFRSFTCSCNACSFRSSSSVLAADARGASIVSCASRSIATNALDEPRRAIDVSLGRDDPAPGSDGSLPKAGGLVGGWLGERRYFV